MAKGLPQTYVASALVQLPWIRGPVLVAAPGVCSWTALSDATPPATGTAAFPLGLGLLVLAQLGKLGGEVNPWGRVAFQGGHDRDLPDDHQEGFDGIGEVCLHDIAVEGGGDRLTGLGVGLEQVDQARVAFQATVAPGHLDRVAVGAAVHREGHARFCTSSTPWGLVAAEGRCGLAAGGYPACGSTV